MLMQVVSANRDTIDILATEISRRPPTQPLPDNDPLENLQFPKPHHHHLPLPHLHSHSMSSFNPSIFLPHRHHLFPLSDPFTPRLSTPRNTHSHFPLPCELLLNPEHQLSPLRAMLLASACARQQAGRGDLKFNDIVEALEALTRQAMDSVTDSNDDEQSSTTNIEITVTTAVSSEGEPAEQSEVNREISDSNEALTFPAIQNASDEKTTEDGNILDNEIDRINTDTEEENESFPASPEVPSLIPSKFVEPPLTKFDPFSRAKPLLQFEDMCPAQPPILQYDQKSFSLIELLLRPIANHLFGALFTVSVSLLVLIIGIQYWVGLVRKRKVSSSYKSGFHSHIAKKFDNHDTKRFRECKIIDERCEEERLYCRDLGKDV
ncbi:11309_t:CDS:1 [Acaulospora colombiana]|uniref:11309_t:CDS:1 n=1 Tax=Acaulospora colombiana TaxID=27376 RepID=A0ACA9NID1_9GLOM|nr:11309_t:CDS:1 [Acaulospora colombiana]